MTQSRDAQPVQVIPLRLRFGVGDMAVRSALRQWRGWMDQCGAPRDLTGRGELALAEILNNITEHGHDAGGQGHILLRCALVRDGLRVVVSDTGRTMPQSLLQVPRDDALGLSGHNWQTLPEGGFGWSLIHLLTRNLRCRSDGAGNRLSCLIPYDPN